MWPRPWLLLTQVSEAELGRWTSWTGLGPGGESAFPREGDSLKRRRGDVKRPIEQPDEPLNSDRAPVLRHVVRGTQGQRVQREGRVHARDRGKEAPSRDEEVGDVVGAAVAVGDRVFRAFPHDRAAEEVREARAGVGRGFLSARRLDDAVALGA